MNEQKAPAGIEWTRIRNPDGTFRRGFTWNVFTGCLHDCEWDIAGERAECYAKTLAGRWNGRGYPNGFAATYYHPERLDLPKKYSEGAGIFPDSQSDLFGQWILKDWRLQFEGVLQTMRDTPQHIYQTLTKNTTGYRQVDGLPKNLWLGISSPPDHFVGTNLSDKGKRNYLHSAFETLGQKAADGYVTWMSFEPLSQNWAEFVEANPGALKWAVIGAASNGSTLYPPEEGHVRALIEVLDAQGVAVFFKGNMRSLPWARDHWRDDFPAFEVVA